MFSKEVLVLVLVALGHHVQGDCMTSFSLAGPKFTEVVAEEADDWHSMVRKCMYKNRWTEILDRVDRLGPDEYKLCGGGRVPYGIEKYPERYMKVNGGEVKMGNTIHLGNSSGVKPEDYESGHGVLDLSTGTVHFTDSNETFTCVICQAMESVSLDDIQYSNYAYDEYSHDKIFVITLVSNDKQAVVQNLSNESQADFQEQIASTLGNVTLEEFAHESSVIDSNSFLEMKFRCRMSDWYYNYFDVAEFQNVSLNSRYSMSVEDVSKCPQKNVTCADGVVKVVDSGRVGSTKSVFDASNWTLSQFTCKSDRQTGRRLWTQTNLWNINHAPCSDLEQYANKIKYVSIIGPEVEYNQKHQLQQYTSPPIDVTKLDDVAHLTSLEINVVGKMTSEMHDDLRNILATLQTNGKVVNVQKPRVSFVVADLPAKANAVNGFTLTFNETGKGEIVEPMQVGLNTGGRFNQTGATVSLTVSSGLVEGADRLAFATFAKPRWSYDPESLERYLEVEVVVVGDKAGKAVTAGYVDIYYDLSNAKEANNVSCKAITEDSRTEYGWSYYSSQGQDSDGCKHLEARTKKQIVCRCDTKSFVDNNESYTGAFELKEKYDYYSSYSDDYSNDDRANDASQNSTVSDLSSTGTGSSYDYK